MFVSRDIPCAIRAVALKIETDDGVEKRVAHASVQVEPFLPALAHELGEDIYDHLFMRDPQDIDQDVPKPEIAEVGFLIRCGLQRIEAKAHPDLKVEAELRNVRITKVRVTRPDPDKPRLSLGFTLSIELTSKSVMDWIVRAFARVNHLTFTREQLDLIAPEGEQAPRETAKQYADRRMREIREDVAASVPDDCSMTLSAGGKSATITSADAARARKAVAARRDRNARQARKGRR